MVSTAATREDYQELKDYIVYNHTEGILYFKAEVGKFNKLYNSKNWNSSERRLTFSEFQQYWPQILDMINH